MSTYQEFDAQVIQKLAQSREATKIKGGNVKIDRQGTKKEN